ncbi:flavin reductase family protein [Paeniroseomonas aquatica]|uniref:flavin reductase family protein n=1 Tax=Paeniroseomonas aquatica TaxID=373043 RepID=UPI00362052F5
MLFDFETLSPQDCYKLVVSSVVPRPIAWVVTQDAAGVTNAAPYSFFNAFSSNPVVVGIGCGPKAPDALKDTAANIRATGEFVVCLVPETAVHQMNATAVDFEPGWTRSPRPASAACLPPRSSRRASPKARWRWNA